MPRLALTLPLLLAFSGAARSGNSEEADFFEARIRPVLVEKCFECHSAEAEQLGGELLLDSRDGLRAGGESGAAIEVGRPDESLLIKAVEYEGLEMPPDAKLPDRVIADFRQWINAGAYDPREGVSTAPPKPSIDVEAGRQFWSFQQPTEHAAPSVQDKTWSQRKLDRFILAKLEQHDLRPANAAPRRALIRRLSFDLTGLPPTPAEVAAFLFDESPDAYRRLVDRLLASPQFGPRWARMWLDVARYAEDQAHIVGNNQELFYPNAYVYRDWVIQTFNQDLPFDRFVKLQLAADLIEPEDSTQLMALGFLGLGPKYYRRNAPEVMADEWEDRVDTVTRGLLGLTVACARCHDHKYDPIPTEDYYALAGVFASTEMYNRPDGDWKPTEKQKKPDPSKTIHVVRDTKPLDIKVHIRGDAFNEGELAPRRLLQVLSDAPTPLQDGSGRRQLAEAIANPHNPLTARVIVNRIWGEYFGRSLVSTPSNFGNLGEPPTHPELLDDLAVRFMRAGWSLKWLHREIVLSATYQQSSLPGEATLAADPGNLLLGRMNRRRLSIEMWRDALLAASDSLDLQVGGKSLDVQDLQELRRSIYSKVSRLELDSLLQLFDFPDPNVHAAKRSETITPLQKLFVLNSPFMVKQAQRLAARLERTLDSNEQIVTSAYELLYARPPMEEELVLAGEFLAGGPSRWETYVQILLAANEMLYLD